MIKPTQTLLAGLGLIVAPGLAGAQVVQANQQLDAVQQQRQLTGADQAYATNTVPALVPDEMTDVGPQSVLKLKPRRQLLEASADLQYFYTDNALFTEHDRKGSDVLVGTVEAALDPTPYALGNGYFSPRLGFQQQWYNYGLADQASFQTYDYNTHTLAAKPLGALDFNAQTIFMDAAWRWRNWIFTAGTDYRRLMDSTEYSQFYSELVPRWSAERLITLGENTSLALSYQGTYRVTDTSQTAPGLDSSGYNRTDQSLMAAGAWKLCPRLILQPYYRFEFSHYTGIHRDDALNSCGLVLVCPLSRQVSVRAFVSYDHLNTDGAYAQSYDNLSAGGGLNLTVTY